MSSSESTRVLCASCGRNPVPASGDRCDSCRRDADAGTMIATDTATMLARPAPAATEPDVTMLVPPRLGQDPEATILTPAAAVDPGATILAPSGDPQATVLATGGVSDATSPGAPPVTAAAGEHGPLAVGEVFGRYTIVRLLGIGGMGAVYQAWDKELEVVVALKVIRPEVLRDPVAAEELERRFKRELLLARQVTHRNVVRIYDLGEIRGIKYITMSYVDGKDLATLIKEVGQLSINTTLRIMRSVISGLVAAHAADVVHRDLKPANIMIGKDGEALIMDFGIARSITTAPAEASMRAREGASVDTMKASGRYTEATVLGSIVGTVDYMAPEQARGEAVDQRADIYTTGLILYDMLAGKRRAERPGSALDQLKQRMESPMPALKTVAPEVPDALAAVVMRAVQTKAEDRYQTSAELLEALDQLDEHGNPKPVKRVVGLRWVAAVVVLLLGLTVGAWYFGALTSKPAGPVEQVAVVIADFENRTGDAAFSGTLEPMLRRALEGSSFITAHDRNGIRRVIGVAANALPEKLDETAARDIALKNSLGVVLSGSIEKRGSGFTIAMKASRAMDGEVIADVSGRAAGADNVVATATDLVGEVREALGDQTATDPMFKMLSLSAASLEVVRLYAAAQAASTSGNFAEAKTHLTQAVTLDPNFGVGYLALAGVARVQGDLTEAERYINQAQLHLATMTEREQLTTRGMSFRLSGDYKNCVDQHQELINRYAADVIGQNQLALCASQLRQWDKAIGAMQAIVKLLPNRAVFRDNLALYSNYNADFEMGEAQARIVLEQNAANKVAPDSFALLAVGMAQLAKGQPAEARQTYASMARLTGLGPTQSAQALTDLAVYEGRYAEAVKLAEQGAAADLKPADKNARPNPDRAAAKYAHQAYAHLLRGQKAAAVASADKALANSKAIKIRFLAARIFVEAGQPARARPLMTALAAEIHPEPQAYAKIIEALTVMAGKDARPAIKLLTEANELFGTWIGRFDLGRAYLATNQFLQADSEFAYCLTHRGEALALFLDEEPTYGYFPLVHYYQGRAREGLKLPGAAQSYRAYLAIREKAGEDPLIADLRRRVGR